jgi:putative colanic acid biosynthesis glycosyltransferase WcaI
MARILFVTPYYPPEVGAAHTYISETAQSLARRGHDVTVLTALPNYPLGIVHPEYRHGKNRREVRDGVKVVRIRHYIAPNRGFLRRTLSQLSFGLSAAVFGGSASRRPDVVIAISPPLFTIIGGRVLAWRKHCPFIFNVSDLWPEAAIQIGVLRNPLAIRFSEAVEQWGYRGAAAVWTVTPGVGKALLERRHVPPEKIFVVPTGADTQLLRPLPKDECRQRLGWDSRFTLVHCGTIGLNQYFDTLLDTVSRLRDDPDLHVVLVGDGATKESLSQEVQRRGLGHMITFAGLQPRQDIPHFIGAADACYCALQQVPLFEGTMPMKAYEAISCGRPLILAAEGDSRRIFVDDAQAALYIEPGNVEALVQAIRRLRQDSFLSAQLGRQGRAYVEAHFDREQLTGEVEAHILEVIRQRRPKAALNTTAGVTMRGR